MPTLARVSRQLWTLLPRPMRSFGRSVLTAFVLVSALTVDSGRLTAGGTTSEDDLVELKIQNGADVALRCVTLLAHFVSLPAVEVAPGETFSVSYFRRRSDGSLYVLRDDGREMMIENLLCGSSEEWDQTRGDVPLLDVRSSAANQVALTCRVANRLECAAIN